MPSGRKRANGGTSARAARWPSALICASIGVLALAASSCADGGAPKPAGTRPNVVVVMTDDQAVDTMRAMPFTRRAIGGEGVVFTNSVVSFPLCCPSRASFLTGQYAHNHGVLDNKEPAGGYARLDSERTLPVWLRRAGYRTGFVGKYLNGYGRSEEGRDREVPPGWSDWYGLPASGKKRVLDYDLNENGELVHYGPERANYKTDVLARKAAGFIDDASGDGEPFFLWVATSAPHIDRGAPRDAERNPEPAPRHHGSFEGARPRQGASFNERDVSDKPRYVRSLRPAGSAKRREMSRIYVSQLESLRAVDDLVRAAVRALRRSGELDRTLLVFTSDNGFLRGQHRIDSGKAKLYEESIRVPLLVRGPGFPSGARSDDVVANVDLAPTILELAGAEADVALDGTSLIPPAHGRAPDRAVLLEVFERRADRFTGVRTRRFVYAERDGDRNELYDLRRDPEQLENRVDDPALAEVREALGERLSGLRGCAGEECLDA